MAGPEQNPDDPEMFTHPHWVKKVRLPSGGYIEVVYFEDPNDIEPDKPDKESLQPEQPAAEIDEITGVDQNMEEYVRRSIEALDHIEPMDF
jgi:hypothetical protein